MQAMHPLFRPMRSGLFIILLTSGFYRTILLDEVMIKRKTCPAEQGSRRASISDIQGSLLLEEM